MEGPPFCGLDKGMQFPAGSTDRLGYAKGFLGRMLLLFVLENLLRPEGKGVALVVAVVFQHSDYHARLLIRVYCLLSYKNMRVTRVS